MANEVRATTVQLNHILYLGFGQGRTRIFFYDSGSPDRNVTNSLQVLMTAKTLSIVQVLKQLREIGWGQVSLQPRPLCLLVLRARDFSITQKVIEPLPLSTEKGGACPVGISDEERLGPKIAWQTEGFEDPVLVANDSYRFRDESSSVEEEGFRLGVWDRVDQV